MKQFIHSVIRKLGFELKKYNIVNSEHALLKHIILKNNFDLILDIGANIGQFGHSVKKMGYNKTIYSFEPMNLAYQKLSKTASKYKDWQTFNFALGDEERKDYINIASNSFSSSILPINQLHLEAAPQSNYVNKEEILIKKLDNVLNEQTINNYKSILLKIDAQGFEDRIILGGTNTLAKSKVVLIEVSFVKLYEDSLSFFELADLLKQSNFFLFSLQPNFRLPTTGQLLQADAVFYQNDYFQALNSKS